MAVYADLVMLFNFLVDLLLLLGTSWLSGIPPRPVRCFWAAALGGLYAGLVLLPQMRFLGALPGRAAVLGLMGMTAFGPGADALKRTGAFLILTMALGGLALSLGRSAWTSVLLSAAGLWLLCRVSFGAGNGAREYLPLELTREGRTVRLTALLDTGNTLRDPLTGEGVLVIEPEAARILTGLTVPELKRPLENLEKLPGLRLIPYRAVGSSGFLLGLRFADARIGGKRQNVIVAFAPEGLDRKGAFQALAGGAL